MGKGIVEVRVNGMALTRVARGNGRVGYRGVVRLDQRNGSVMDSLDLSECSHRHPETGIARDCARGQIEEMIR